MIIIMLIPTHYGNNVKILKYLKLVKNAIQIMEKPNVIKGIYLLFAPTFRNQALAKVVHIKMVIMYVINVKKVNLNI